MKKIFSIIFFIVLGLKLFESFLPYDHSDPLYYHLAGARIWYEYSWSHLWENLTAYAQAGYFDLAYVLLFYVFSSLLTIQIFGQILHLLFSLVFASFFIRTKLKHSIFGILGAISLLTISKDSSYFVLAKNDGVMAFCALVLSYLIIERKSYLWIGVCFGLLVGIKMSGLFVAIPLFCIFLVDFIFKKRKWSEFLKCSLIVVLLIAPQLIKNTIYTGNPFFPGLLKSFPGTLTPAILDHYFHFFDVPITKEIFWQLIADFFLGKFVFLLAIPLFILNWKEKRTRLNLYYLVATSVFILYLYLNGGYRAARFFFSSFFITNYFIFRSLDFIDFKKLIKPVSIVLLLLIFADSKLDKSFKRGFTFIRDISTLSEEKMIDKHIPHVEIWKSLPKNEGELIYILTDYRSESFYLPKGYRLHQPDHTRGPNFFYYCQDPEDIQKIYQYKYMLMGYWRDNPCYHHVKNKTKLILKWNEYSLYQLF